MSKPKKKIPAKIVTSVKTSATGRPKTISRGFSPLAALGVILLLVFIAYRPVLKSEFINYDDDIYITENPMIVNPDAKHFRQLFSEYYFNQYAPVAMTIMAAEVSVFGMKPAPLKLWSILLHLANTLLVFFLIRQIFGRSDYAIITAALFGLHPMQVESVAWLTASMKIGAYAFFFLAALIAYVQYLSKYNIGFYLAALLLFLLSCFSKEQAIALSVTLLAVDYIKGRELLSKRVILEKIPFFVISLIFAYITLSIKEEMQSEQLATYYNAFDRLIFSGFALSSYWIKLMVPAGLSAFYTYPLKSAIPWYYYASAILALCLLFALYYVWKRNLRILAFAIIFFLTNIFLTILSQILSVRDIIMADRYVYLPVIGFALIVAWLFNRLLHHRPQLTGIAWAGMFIIGLILAWQTYNRGKVWENSISIFSDAIKKGASESDKFNPFLALAYNNRGIARKNKGDLQGALEDYNTAIQANSSYPIAYLNRANILFNAGKYKEAIPDYDKTLELNPMQAKAYSNRGAAYAGLQQNDKAIEDLNRAIDLDPNYTDALQNRALVQYNIGQFEGALSDLERFLRLKPNNADILNFKGLALKQLKRLEEAEQAFDRSIQLNPNQGVFYHNRSLLRNQKGQKAKALEDAQRAQSLGASISSEYLESLK